MSTYTSIKVNFWAYLSRLSLTGLIGVMAVALIAGQLIGSTVIGKYIGLSDFKAGIGIQYIFYMIGTLLAIYTVGWMNPNKALREGDNPYDRLIIGMIIAGIVFLIAIFILPLFPGLFSVMPMQPPVNMNMPPFSVVPIS